MIGIKKRFQLAKCKTSLKLATARIKLMRNKKGAQVIQMKKELAQLLASGDDRTARIKVEHVIREEKMIGAYDLIEIYCELIVARLPIIESQKTCPMDLKEAIASVIFATPRCSDITELVDVKKNFRAKYGKEFVTAATDLIPGCGVSSMLVEKLSVAAPNIQTKVKVLSDVAKEHNIDWEATSFEESKPRDDLLATPITVDVVQSYQTTPDIPADFFQLNKRFTSDAQNNVTPADTSHNDARPTGMTSGSMKKNKSPNSSDNGDTEFKDATSAAHAAAEAAERASYAAQAAAKLARQGSDTQQNLTKSHESHIRDENTSTPKVTKGSRSRNGSDEGSVNYDDHGSTPQKSSKKETEARLKIQNQKVRQNEINSSPKVTKSSRLRNDSDEGSVDYDDHQEDRYHKTHKDHGPYPRKSSMKETEARLKIQNQNVRQNENNSSPKVTKSSRSRNDSDEGSVNYDDHQEDRYHKTHKDHGSTHQKSSKKKYEPRFKRGDSRYNETDYDDEDDQGSSSPEISSWQKSKKTSSFSDAHRDDESKSKTKRTSGEHDELTSKSKKVGRKTVVDQEPVVRKTKKTSSFSDDESESDDDDYDGPRFDAGFDHVELEDAGKSFFPSPDKEVDSHVWSPIKNTSNTKDRVKLAKSVDYSVKSNLSDGPDSGSEPETVNSGFSGSYKYDSPRKQDFSRNSRTELDDLMQRSSSYHKQSDISDTEEDLRFGTLAGSRRNKGDQKPHTKITSPSSKKPVEESQSPVKVGQTSFNSRPKKVEKKKPSVYKRSSESDSDENDDKFPEKPSRSPFARPNTFFSYGNDSDQDEEVSTPKHTPQSKAQTGPHGASRRTKVQVEPKAKQSRVEPAEDFKKRPTNTISPPKPRPHTTRPKQEPPKRNPEHKVSKPEVSTPPVEVDNVKKPSHVPTSTISPQKPRPDATHPKQEPPKRIPEPKVSKPEVSTPPADNVKKPSHVHPKLPDFEDLADRIYAINKMERQ